MKKNKYILLLIGVVITLSVVGYFVGIEKVNSWTDFLKGFSIGLGSTGIIFSVISGVIFYRKLKSGNQTIFNENFLKIISITLLMPGIILFQYNSENFWISVAASVIIGMATIHNVTQIKEKLENVKTGF